MGDILGLNGFGWFSQFLCLYFVTFEQY